MTFFEVSCTKLTAIPAEDRMLVREHDAVLVALLDNIAARKSFPSQESDLHRPKGI